MTLLAGVDIGNATTEVVLVHCRPGGVEVVGAGRVPTRQVKGSAASIAAAAALVHRLERQHRVAVEGAVVAALRPVQTVVAMLPEAIADTGRLRVRSAGAGTTGGHGAGFGRPVRLGDPLPGTGPIVLVVPAGTGYRAAVAGLVPLLATGRVRAVLLADDEAVLVANRLGVAAGSASLPVVDELDAEGVLAAELVAVEVSDGPLRVLTDPLRMASGLGLGRAEVDDAARIADLLADSTCAVVTLAAATAAHGRAAGDQGYEPAPGGWIECAGIGRLGFIEGLARIRAGPVGLAQAFALPPGDPSYDVDDLWGVDLAMVAGEVLARRPALSGRPVGLAALRADAPVTDPSGALAEALGVPVRLAGSEADAARRGALSTPGTGAGADAADEQSDVVVVDLGAGTVDAVSAGATVVAAGCGDLLTIAVSALTGASAAAAEHVKRGPAWRVEAPQVILGEDGARSFLDRPAPRETVGSLVVRGPAGLLPFHRTLAPGEWRALRRRLKVDLLGANVCRALRTLDVMAATVVVVGGPAGDDELLATVAAALPPGTPVGRGNVAGTLGHRYAVAHGLLLKT